MKYKKWSLEVDFFIKVYNKGSDDYIIDNISTSCKCIVLENNLPLQIKSHRVDSLRVSFIANEVSTSVEKIFILHNLNERFTRLSLEYEIYD